MRDRLISHRGNLTGPNRGQENNPAYIDIALEDFDVELDIRFVGDQLFLGHDEPQYPVSPEWLLERCDMLWVHCKDFKTLQFLLEEYPELTVFYHNSDLYTLTSYNTIWAHPYASELDGNMVYVDQGNSPESVIQLMNRIPGLQICTDFPLTILNTQC